MAEGISRRAAAVDNLRGAEAVEPVTRNVPGVSAPSTPRVPVDSFGAQIAQSVSKFATGALAQAQKKKQEKSIMDGQLAAMQGQSFDSVEMEGDKWALEGYRLVTAQTMSATLLRSQEQEINSGGYEMDPEAYRSTLVDRIDAMTSSIGDERTRDLARESLMQQMPTLVDSHMKQNLGFKESQNFEALAQSVDVLSRDNSSTGALVAFATGESDATAGLSIERRRAAVVQGVVNAFENDNPAAFAHLEGADYFNTENLTSSQLRTIKAAQAAYHSRMENEWNADWKKEDTRIRDAIAAGDLDPMVAVEQMAANNAKHGRRTSSANAGAVYDSARAGVEFNQGTRGINIQAAAAAGDYTLQAELMQAAVIQQESLGDPNAVSPVGATGIMQLMPDTMLDPGFGIRNIFQVASDLGVPFDRNAASLSAEADKLARNPEVNKAMGTEYLATMLERYNGDIPRALAAYNWGAGNVDKWDGDMAKLPEETRTYIKNITGNLDKATSDNRPDPQADRIAAETRLKEVRAQAKLDVFEQVTPALDILDEDYRKGNLTHSEWIEQSRETMGQWGMEVDMQRLNHEAQINRSVIRGISEKAESTAATEREIAMADEMRVAQVEYDEVIRQAENGTIGQQEVQAAVQGLTQTRMALHEKYGVPYTASEVNTRRDAAVGAAVDAVRTGRVAAEKRVERQRAAAMGTAGALPLAQQEKLVAENDAKLRQKYTDAVSAEQLSPEVAQAQFETERLQHLASTGIVQETQKRVINAGLDQEPMLDGKVNPAFQESVEAYQIMRATNPATADKYIDIENRAVLDTILSRVGTNGNLGAAIQNFSNQSSRAGNSPYKTPEEFIDDPKVEKQIRAAAKSQLARDRVGLFQGIFSSEASIVQAFDRRSGLDYEEAQSQLEDALTREVQRVQSYHPNLRTSDIIQQAQERVARRYTTIGNNVLDVGEGNDAHELFFGSRGDEMRGRADSVNEALMHYIRTPEFREEYPNTENSTFAEASGLQHLWKGFLAPGANALLPAQHEFNTEYSGVGPIDSVRNLVTGSREFRINQMYNPNTGKLNIEFQNPDGSWSEPIALDPSKVGEKYLDKIRQTNR